MTITTAKLASCIRRAYTRPLVRSAPLALSALLAAGAARAQELTLDALPATLAGLEVPKQSANSWRIVPLLDLRQIYTDNVSLQADERKQGQFLTEIAPGLSVKHSSRRLKLDGQFQLRGYLNNNDEAATRRSSKYLRANAKSELVDDMLFVDASASIFQQSISPFGPQTADNDYASANRSEVKTWQISPYLLNRFGRVAVSELRYRRDHVDAGNSGLSRTDGDTLSLRISNGTAWDDLGWNLRASQQEIRDPVRNDSTVRNASLNLTYQLRSTLRLLAGVAYDDYDYQAIGGATGGSGWDAGARWTPSRRTSVTATLGHRYYGPSRTLLADHRTRRTSWNLSYNDTVVTSRSNFLLDSDVIGPGPVIPVPADLNNGLPLPPVTPGVPPVLRPPVTSVNFFSNRFSLQKLLRASVTLRGARSSAAASFYKSRREALSERGVDDVILGSPIENANDNISQTGVNATLSYKLQPRSTLSLSADATDNESLTTGSQARAGAVRLILRHQLGRKIAASGELRRVSGVTGLTTGARYTENALSVSLNIKL